MRVLQLNALQVRTHPHFGSTGRIHYTPSELLNDLPTSRHTANSEIDDAVTPGFKCRENVLEVIERCPKSERNSGRLRKCSYVLTTEDRRASVQRRFRVLPLGLRLICSAFCDVLALLKVRVGSRTVHWWVSISPPASPYPCRWQSCV